MIGTRRSAGDELVDNPIVAVNELQHVWPDRRRVPGRQTG